MKNGFSVIELLASIIILGVISSIGVVIYDNVVHNMRIKAYKAQRESIILSSENWLINKKGTEFYPDKFPYKLSLKELLNDELIEKDICNQEERVYIDYDSSYVEIIENGKIFEYNLVINNKSEECRWFILRLIMNILNL